MNINVTCPINSLGYGVVGTNVVLSLDRLGHTPALWPLGPVEAQPRHQKVLERAGARSESYDKTGPSLRIYHQYSLAQHVGRGPHCGLPIFELNKFTDAEWHHMASQDVLFVSSLWAKHILEENKIGPTNVVVTPFGVDPSIFYPRQQERLPGPTTFINVGKWELRKGHEELIKAYCLAFKPTDNVRLIMVSFNPCFQDQAQMKQYNESWASRYKNSPMGETITLLPRLGSQYEVAAMMATADCGVFPAKAEGWNLDLAEMMAMGKHVITTNFSAHTEFCDSSNALLIGIDSLEDAYDGVWFFGQGQWAELGGNQLDALVEHMRSVHSLVQDGTLGVNQAGIDTMKRFTWDAMVKRIIGAVS